MNTVPLDFSMVFDTISSKILREKLLKYGLDEQKERWIKNELNGQAQRVLVRGAVCLEASSKQSVPGSLLGPVCFTSLTIQTMGQRASSRTHGWHRTGGGVQLTRGPHSAHTAAPLAHPGGRQPPALCHQQFIEQNQTLPPSLKLKASILKSSDFDESSPAFTVLVFQT